MKKDFIQRSFAVWAVVLISGTANLAHAECTTTANSTGGTTTVCNNYNNQVNNIGSGIGGGGGFDLSMLDSWFGPSMMPAAPAPAPVAQAPARVPQSFSLPSFDPSIFNYLGSSGGGGGDFLNGWGKSHDIYGPSLR